MIKLIFPVKYVGITQGYKSTHKAIDMGWTNEYGALEHEIIAAYDGVVTYVKSDYNKTDKDTLSYGNYVKIDHGNSVTTLYAHMKYNTVCVKVGDKVKRGDKIGIMGNTGYSKGRHLHYEVIINKEKVNPLMYTYITNDHILGSNTRKKYNILSMQESIKVEEETKEVVKDETIENETIENNDNIVDNVIFEYIVPKTGEYRIKLNQNEKLIIKD